DVVSQHAADGNGGLLNLTVNQGGSGRAGKKRSQLIKLNCQQSEDEIIGGRALSESPKDVARMMKKRGEASDIRIDDLPLKL
ncbi:hypothetical protein ACSLOT_28090, partial [Escherichia coli]|uniref:hypothetical protein n=1 Tax=Escherichia coli TaxID=562 RepID=UPI003EDEC475